MNGGFNLIDITNSSLRPEEKTAVALGYFDGLHLGHVGVIRTALAQEGLKPAVFTFNCDTTLPKLRLLGLNRGRLLSLSWGRLLSLSRSRLLSLSWDRLLSLSWDRLLCVLWCRWCCCFLS